MRSDIVPGAVFPDYELPDHTAKRRKLSALQEQNPMVLILSRGGFCPKERRQAEGLLALHREIEVGYCRLVTISTDNLTETSEFRIGVGAHWPSYLTPGELYKRISTLPNTRILFTIPRFPTRLSLSRILSFTRSTWATGFSDGPRLKNCAETCVQ
jgi:hypothetical protein